MAHTSITAVWSGASGLPGYSKFRFAGELDSAAATTAAAHAKDFLFGAALYVPNTIKISFDGVAQIFDSAGRLTGDVAYTPPAQITGSSAAAYSAPVGAVATWNTGLFANGRRVRGRTFLVPLAGCFDTDGTLSASGATQLRAAASAFAASTPTPIVFGRGGLGIGIEAPISSATVPDKAAVLRSRRD